jgi:hypothetical protein
MLFTRVKALSWLHQIHVKVGQQQRSSNSTRVLILFKKNKKKQLNCYQATISQMKKHFD